DCCQSRDDGRLPETAFPATARNSPTARRLRRSSGRRKRILESPYFVMVPDTLRSVSFIEKDTKRFPDTNGSAYAQRDGPNCHGIAITRRGPGGRPSIPRIASNMVRETLACSCEPAVGPRSLSG